MDIEQLNFSVIVDDKDFDKQVSKIESRAKKFNTDVSKSLELELKIKSSSVSSIKGSLDAIKSHAEKNARDIANALKNALNIKVSTSQVISSQGVANAKEILNILPKIANEIRNLPKAPAIFDPDKLDRVLDQLEKGMGPSSPMVDGLTKAENLTNKLAQLTGIAFGAAGVRSFVKELVNVTGEFEVQKMALTSMIQDANKADRIFEQLKQNALESPYTFQDLAKYAKQLTAFNIPIDDLVDTEKRLADVSAGLGVDLGRIILAYGQVKAAGILKGTELRQFTEAGVPLLEELAKQIKETEGHAISLSEVFQRISKKQIPFAMVEEAFRRMTNEGGKFYNMQEVLVETLQGKIGKLRDVWQQMLYSVGSNTDVLKKAVDKATDFVANIGKYAKAIELLIVGFGHYVAILGVVTAAQQLAFGVQTIMNIGRVIKQFNSLTTAAGKFAAMSKLASPVSLALAAITTAAYAAYHALTDVSEAQKRLNDATAKYETKLATEIDKIGRLRAVLKDAKKGTDEWNEAKKEAVSSYSQYFAGLDKEIEKVGNLETAYTKLIEKVSRSISIRQFADFYNSEKENYKLDEDKYLKEAQTRMVDNLGSYEGTLLFRQFRGIISSAQGDQRELVNEWLGNLDKEVYNSINADAWFQKYTDRLEKSYDEFWSNVLLARERMGLGDVIMDPETLLTRLMSDNEDKSNYTWKPTTSGKSKEQKKIESDIDAIKELQRAYNDLINSEYSKEDANALIDVYFSWMDASLRDRRDFWEALNEQADLLEKYDKEAADRLRADVGRGQAKEKGDKLKEETKAAKNAEKELNKYLEALEKWTNQEKALEGTGVAYKLNKAIADYRKGMEEAQSKYDKITSMPGANKLGNIQALLNLGRDQNGFLAKLKNNLSGLVDEIVKEGLKKQGMDLSDLAHKNLSQILNIKDAVGKIELPKSTRDAIKALGPEGDELLKNLEDSLKQFIAALTENELDPKILDKIGKGAKFTASQIRKLAGSFGELADATNNADLKGVAESIESIGNFASSVADGYKQGNVYGAIVSAVVWMAQQVIGGAEAMEKANAEFQKKTEAAAIAYKNAINSAKVDSNDTIFGSDTIGRMTELLRIVSESTKELEKFRSAFRTIDGTDIFGALGYSKENGEIDIEKLLSDIENGLLSGSGTDKIKDLINNYKESLKGLDDIVESVFGNVASDAADKIVDSWIEAGDAALNYVDILDDVARAYSKMLVQSMIMETFLDPITDDLKKAFYENRYDDAMAMIAGAMQGISDSAPMFENILKAFDPYFTGSSTDGSLGSGIKSITEETASLLASYINAMRADLSYMRGLQEKGWGTVELMGQAVPTLNEYMAQVAANTDRSAQNTQSILEELRSVIGAPDSSGSIMRVQMA